MEIPKGEHVRDDDQRRQIEELRRLIDRSEGRRIHAHLTSYLRTLTVWQGFANSLLTLLQDCERDDQMMISAMTSMRRADPRDPIINALDSSLVAYAAGVGAVIDQTRELINKHGDRKVKGEFEQRKGALEELVPCAPLIVKLRNYLLHYLSAPWGVTLHVNNEGDAQVTTFKVQLGRDQLLQMQGWSSPAKAFLEKQEPDIHVTPLIQTFTQAEAELAAWAHNAIMELRGPEMDATNELIRELNLALTGGAHDGSDWEGFYDHMSENLRRMKAGDPQVGWREGTEGT